MKVKKLEAKGDHCIINFGPILRSDPRSTFKLCHMVIPRGENDEPGEPMTDVVREGPIPAKGKLRIKLSYGERYVVIAHGIKIAGVVHTAGESLMAPFHVSIDADRSTAEAMQKELARRQAAPHLSPVAAGVKQGLNGQGKR